jgi:hypothetical protein
MIGKILGGIVGAKAADHVRGIGGTGGALLGVGAATLARRLSLPAMLALAAGGYAYKRYSERRDSRAKRTTGAKRPKVQPSAT